MLRTRIRPEIDPDEYLRSHPVLTASDLAAASQVGQLPGTAPDEQEMTFSLDEVDALPGVAPTAIDPWEGEPEPLGNGGNMFANASPFQIPDRVAGAFSGGPMQVLAMGSRRDIPAGFGHGRAPSVAELPDAPEPDPGFMMPGIFNEPEQPATAASAPLRAAPQAPTMPQMRGMLPGTALDAMPAPGPNPFRTTDADRKALEDAEKRDNRLRIASGIMRGLGFMTQLGAGIAGNNPLGNAAGTAAVNFQPEINGAEQVRAQIAERQANDYRAAQYDEQQRAAAMRGAAEQQQFALRSRMAQSTEQLNQARAEQERLRTQQMQASFEAVAADRGAALSWLRNLASQYPNAPIAQGVLRDTEPGGALANGSAEQLNLAARQLSTLAASGQVAGRAAIGRSPGGGGTPLPGPGGGPPVDTSIDNRVREFLRLQDVDLDTEAGQYALATALERAHGDSTESRAFRAEMDQAFSSTASGGDVYPAGVDPRTYMQIAAIAGTARTQVQPFVSAISALDTAMERGLSGAGWQAIRAGGGLGARVAHEFGLPNLRAIVADATDALGRLRSGGAINADEEARFRTILADDSIWSSPQMLRDALHRLNANVAAAVQARFDAAGPQYWPLYQRRTGRRR